MTPVMFVIGALALGTLFGLNLMIRINDNVRFWFGMMLAAVFLVYAAVSAAVTYAASVHSSNAQRVGEAKTSAVLVAVLTVVLVAFGVGIGAAISEEIAQKLQAGTADGGSTAPQQPTIKLATLPLDTTDTQAGTVDLLVRLSPEALAALIASNTSVTTGTGRQVADDPAAADRG